MNSTETKLLNVQDGRSQATVLWATVGPVERELETPGPEVIFWTILSDRTILSKSTRF